MLDGELVTDWESDYSPAIIAVEDARAPLWYCLQYNIPCEAVVRRLFKFIGLPLHEFKFREFKRGEAPQDRSWHPGYFFTEFDIDRDYWGQIKRIPGVAAILGASGPASLPQSVVDLLLAHLPRKVRVGELIGRDVRIKTGTLAGWVGKVTAVKNSELEILLMMFGGPIRASVKATEIEVV